MNFASRIIFAVVSMYQATSVQFYGTLFVQVYISRII